MIKVALSNQFGTARQIVTIEIKSDATLGELRAEAVKAFELKNRIEDCTQLVSTYGSDVLDVQNKDDNIVLSTLNIIDCSLFSVVSEKDAVATVATVVKKEKEEESGLTISSCFVLLAAKKDTKDTLTFICNHFDEFLESPSFPCELDAASLKEVMPFIDEAHMCYNAVYDWAKAKAMVETKTTVGDIIRKEGLLPYMRILELSEEELVTINDTSIVSEQQQISLFMRAGKKHIVKKDEVTLIPDDLKEFKGIEG